jgi:hypothetical protein
VQFFGEVLAGAGVPAVVAIAKPCAIIGTDTRELRDLGLNFLPGGVGIAEAGVEDYGGRSRARAINMQLVKPNIDEFAGYRMKARIATPGDGLIINSGYEEPQRKNNHHAKNVA